MIEAKVWREMATSEILDSMDIATRVLKGKGLDSPDQVAKTLALIRDLADILLEMADGESNKKLRQTFIEDLEHIKTLLENYNEGKGKLAEIWDYINARLEVYKFEEHEEIVSIQKWQLRDKNPYA